MTILRRRLPSVDTGAAPPEMAQRVGQPSVGDVVSTALEEATTRPSVRMRPTTRDIADARATATAVRRLPDAPEALARLLSLVKAFPEEEAFQTYAARVLDRVQDARALLVWRGIDRRFPASRNAFLHVLRWTIRLEGLDAARAIHKLRYPDEPSDPSALLLYGRGLLEFRNFEGADEVFGRLIASPVISERVLVDLGKLYVTLGEPLRAQTIAALAEARFGSTRGTRSIAERVKASLQAIEGILPGRAGKRAHLRSAVVEEAFRLASMQGKKSRRTDVRRHVGSVVLINGSLGPGGAERQFTNTALGLQAASVSGRPIDGHDILGPIAVLCRSLHSRTGADFFEPELLRAGLRVHEYSGLPEYGGRPRLSAVRDLLPLLDHLPLQMRDGLVRLTDTLRFIAPDVVHIWQDGSVLATGIAALAAGVPRIILGVRTLPPQDRFERDKPEYETVYRALTAEPSVTLVANSRVAASRYEAWLKLAPGSVTVIPNGLRVLGRNSSAATLALAATFDAATDTDSFTVGSVMRFDENKRPFLWLDAAAALVVQKPNARFIIVGDGPLLPGAIEYADTCGLSGRVLFTGRSAEVGSWLSRMDVFLLLSRFEGLPNVLIEAQLAGVPVVTTQAGGAEETLIQGITGTLLPSSEAPDAAEIARALLVWQRQGAARRELAETVASFAEERFSLERMLELTVDSYLN